MLFPPSFMVRQKSIKLSLPSGPLCPATYGVVKELASIIRPLVGHSLHCIKNTQHFIDHIKCIHLQSGKCMVSYDFKALFAAVPVDCAISIVKHNLQQDPLLSKRTSKSITQVISFLEFCCKNTHSSSRVSLLNGSMVQPWVTPPAPLFPTCSWKSSNPKPSALLPLHSG